MSLWHRHRWKILSKIPMQSAFDQMRDGEKDLRADKWPPWLFRRKCIILMQCETCGKARKIVESNP